MQNEKVAPTNNQTGLLTVAELCKNLSISRTTLYRLEKSGQLIPAGRLGRRVYYSIEQVKSALK